MATSPVGGVEAAGLRVATFTPRHQLWQCKHQDVGVAPAIPLGSVTIIQWTATAGSSWAVSE